MKMIQRFTFLVLLFLSSSLFAVTQQATPTPADANKAKANSCINHAMQYAFSAQQQQFAAAYGIYALLSHNVYRNEPFYFRLPAYWQNTYSYADSNGLDYKVFEKKHYDKTIEAVMVFAGTENGMDWIKGNFLRQQHRQARPHIQRFIQNYPNITKTLTGHSLGGDLALNASYEFADVQAIVFNSNTKQHYGRIANNLRVNITEKGDFAKKFSQMWCPTRMMSSANHQGTVYIQYDFSPPGFISAHKIYPLAQGLLLLGSLNNPELNHILELNCRR